MFEPEIEALPFESQAAIDDVLYRRQVAYLFANSRFYRDKLTAAGFATPEAVGGLDAIAALPMTEKDEIRQTRSDDEPVGTHLCVAACATPSASSRPAAPPARRATSRSPPATSPTGPASRRAPIPPPASGAATA